MLSKRPDASPDMPADHTFPDTNDAMLKPMRLIVMGTGPFALPMFNALLASRHEVLTVITRPPRGTSGRRLPKNPMREESVAKHVPVLAPDDVNHPESIEALRSAAPDLLVVCDYGQILSADVLGCASLGGINLHGSLLPRHRGASPIQWALLEGDPLTGISVIHMTPSLDAGAVITANATPIGRKETAVSLEKRLSLMGADGVLEAIDRLQAAQSSGLLRDGQSFGLPQDESKATRAPRLSKSNGIIDWSLPATSIERMRRALEPWPRTATIFRHADQPKRLVIEDCAVLETDLNLNQKPPGTVLRADERGIAVACGEKSVLAILQVIPEGKRSMLAADFLRGNAIHINSVLG